MIVVSKKALNYSRVVGNKLRQGDLFEQKSKKPRKAIARLLILSRANLISSGSARA